MTVGQGAHSSSERFRFGVFEADLRAGELRKNGLKIRLPAQPFEVLAVMLDRPGEVVTREELQKRLWPDGTFVDFDHSLNNAINKIREALGDSAESPRFVETLSRRGYRFIAPVEGISRGSAPSQPQAPSPGAKHPDLTWLLAISSIVRWTWVWLGAVLVLLATAVGVWIFRGSPEKPQAAPEVIPLTTYPGSERSPSFSPDGNQVAFSWNGEKQDNYDIYVKAIGSSREPERLTTDPAEDVSPAFSPDGRSIGFVRLEKDRATFIIIPSVGGPERSVGEIPAVRPNMDGPLFAWFPNGKWVVTNGLVLLSIETGKTRSVTSTLAPSQLFTDSFPAVSPDGHTLALGRSLSYFKWSIYLLHLNRHLKPTAEPRQLTVVKDLNWSPAWTANGREVVFVSGWDRSGSLHRVKTSGQAAEPELLPMVGGDASWPAISRNANRLAYQQNFFDANIWRLALSNSETAAGPPVRFMGSTRMDISAQYSPDGKRVAFVSNRTGVHSIWVSDANGAKAEELFSQGGKVLGSPSWSPDGKRIAFDSNLAGNMDIYVVRASGGKPVRFTTDPADDNLPSWSRDGNWVYFTSLRGGRRQIWKAPAGGGEAVPMTKNGGFVAIESPDGRSVFYTNRMDQAPMTASDITSLASMALWKVQVTGGEESLVLPSVFRRNFAFANNGIYFVSERGADGKYSIQFLNLATGKVKIVAAIPRSVMAGFSVSPDEQQILYAQVDEFSSDLMLVENFR